MKEKTITIEQLRSEIDSIDNNIVKLLNDRSRVVMEVARFKAGRNMEFHVPGRERQIYERLVERNDGPFPNDALRTVYREIISACLSLESPMKVAFLGPKATFSHLATMQHFGLSALLVPLKSISSVFEEVEKGKAQYGVVPVENSTEGVVSHTLDMLVSSSLKINAEIMLEVHHDLLSSTGRIEDIKKVCSHSQPIAQCRKWLDDNLPGVPLVDVASTATAAQIASEDDSTAAIASELAGNIYDLKIVHNRIEDQLNNFTRFLIVSRRESEHSDNDKTSILFAVKDDPGVLFRMLEPFAKRGINLSKIESRPFKQKAWEYIFFLDFYGNSSDPGVSEALKELETFCQFVKILGSYPRTV